MDLTGNLRFTHDLYLLFVAFFSNVTLISVYFKFSRHVTGPFADPFVDHLTIFVLTFGELNTCELVVFRF